MKILRSVIPQIPGRSGLQAAAMWSAQRAQAVPTRIQTKGKLLSLEHRRHTELLPSQKQEGRSTDDTRHCLVFPSHQPGERKGTATSTLLIGTVTHPFFLHLSRCFHRSSKALYFLSQLLTVKQNCTMNGDTVQLRAEFDLIFL